MSRRIVLFVLFVLSCSSQLIATPAWGQGFSCGYGLEPGFVSADVTGTAHAGHFQSGPVTPLVLFGTTSDLDGKSLTNLQSRTGTMGLTIENLLNPNHHGSLAHYFEQMSENTLHLTGDINPTWYHTTNAFSHYINASPCTIRHWHTGLVMFVNDVLTAADPHVDFGPYDTDNDGDVDLVAVIVPEQFGLTCDANGTVIRRPHINYATGDTTANGDSVFVRLVITSDYRVSFPFMVGTLAHEYGHIMDLPELFDRDNQNHGGTVVNAHDHSAGIGGWGVMARGSNGWEHIERRNGNSARLIDGPNPMSVWSRMQVGWITTANKLVEVTGDTTNVDKWPCR